MKITISKQFRDLIFPLSDREFHLLEQNILEHGVRDPLVVWQANGKSILVDGYHRYKVISRRKIKNFNVNKLKFQNKDDVLKWILDNQLGRRNATPEAISYLRGLRYKLEKKAHGGDRKASGNNYHLKTEDNLSNTYKVSPKTIRNDEKYTDAIDAICSKFEKKEQQGIKNKILSRQTNLSKKDILDIVELGLGIRYIKQVICDIINIIQKQQQTRIFHFFGKIIAS